MNDGSTVLSIKSTFPCAGDSTTLGPAGTRGVGSRKKYRVNTENSSQRIINGRIAATEITDARTEPTKINTQITHPATKQKKINLKAALLALPEYFIRFQVKI